MAGWDIPVRAAAGVRAGARGRGRPRNVQRYRRRPGERLRTKKWISPISREKVAKKKSAVAEIINIVSKKFNYFASLANKFFLYKSQQFIYFRKKKKFRANFPENESLILFNAYGQLSTKTITFAREKAGWIWKEDRAQKVVALF